MHNILSSIKQRLPKKVKEHIVERLFKLEHALLEITLAIPEALSGKYITIHSRPKYTADVRLESDSRKKNYNEFAIVIQGPLVTKNRFTLETALLYKRNFPDAAVILSTWEDQDPETIKNARDAGVEVILSKTLRNGGLLNVNRQIVSSQAGVMHAKKAGKTYVLKTRADQRLYAHRALILLSSLLEAFPVYPGSARGRIIGMGLGGERKKLYLFPDHMLFGYTEDMVQYFSVPLLTSDSVILPFLSPERPFISEGYMCSHYVQKIGYSVATSEKEYHVQLARQFMCIDPSSLDWYWYKQGATYRRFKEHREIEYSHAKDFKIDFSFWLDIYLKNK